MSTATATPLNEPLPATFSALQACERLAAVSHLEPEDLSADLQHRTSQRPRIPLEIVSHAWVSEDIRRLRLTEIYGALGTHIVNIGIFPQPTSILPLMQLEILVVKQRLSLFIMDAILPPALPWTLGVESPPQCLQRLAAAYRAFPPTPKRSEWAQTVISKDAIWSRPNTADAIAPACDATLAFLDWCGTVIAAGQGQRTASEQTDQYRQFLDRFTTICLDNEPSRPYLSSMFGTAWAERYMSESLFCNLGSHDKGNPV